MEEIKKKKLLELRKEYEESGMKVADFARSKGMEYWKARYALRKALRYIEDGEGGKKRVKFRKVSFQAHTITARTLRIQTSYGAEIIIPL